MKKIKNRKHFLAVSLLMLVLVVGAAVTVALGLASTDPVVNTFKAADHETEIEEEVDGTLNKDVTVTNTAEESAAFIRVRLVVSPEEKAVLKFAPDDSSTVGNNWVDGGDGFYYYTKAVAPGESTEQLLDSVAVNNETAFEAGETLDVTVYEESCVANIAAGQSAEVKQIQQVFAQAAG